MRERYVIIPAGGTGSRMGSELPKQMLDLCGKGTFPRAAFRGESYSINQ